jgi:hypothetical protein
MDNLSLFVKLGLDMGKFQKGIRSAGQRIGIFSKKAGDDISKTGTPVNALGGQLDSLASKVAGAFAIERIASFTAEIVRLAGEAEGVEAAFDRIGGQAVLDDLREATRGTVSDLELMKNAVQASNFQIPLEQLASLFEFARRRAKETGENVDFLVQSIVTGIGRKSPLILDNLGISATELKDAFGGAALEAQSIGAVAQAVGQIAQRELQKMGEEATTAADRQGQLTAEFKNLKVELGQELLPIANKFFQALNFGLNQYVQLLGGRAAARQKAFYKALQQQNEENIKQYEELGDAVVDTIERAIETDRKRINSGIKNIAQIEMEKELYGEVRSEIINLSATERVAALQRINNNTAQLQALEEYIESQKQSNYQVTESVEEVERLSKMLAMARTEYEALAGTALSMNMIGGTWIGELNKQAPDLTQNLVELNDEIMTIPSNMLRSAEDTKKLIDELSNLENAALQVQTATQQYLVDGLTQGVQTMISTIGRGGNVMENVIGGLLGGLADLAIQIGKIVVASGIAIEGLQKALKSLGGGGAAVVAGLALIAVGTAAKGMLGNLGDVPAFAEGGIVSGPTLGLMGEYAGAKSNPEVIAPLDKLQSMMGGVAGDVRFEIEGDKLVGILHRNSYQAGRL